jgi:hypothetical protein
MRYRMLLPLLGNCVSKMRRSVVRGHQGPEGAQHGRSLASENDMWDSPLMVFVISLAILWLSANAGLYLGRKGQHLEEDLRDDLGKVLAAALTLLGLIIGFSFSMAISRYDQRKNLEEAEANAIGTEYVRADLLPAAESARVHALLTKYVDQRKLFYTLRNEEELKENDTSTARLQAELWSALLPTAAAQPTPSITLVLSGMNDVLNSQGYTQAAWWNRIPTAAWTLMQSIAICCNVLLAYTSRRSSDRSSRFFILPLILSISFLLIADLDSPRGGLIRVSPQNLISLSHSFQVSK